MVESVSERELGKWVSKQGSQSGIGQVINYISGWKRG